MSSLCATIIIELTKCINEYAVLGFDQCNRLFKPSITTSNIHLRTNSVILGCCPKCNISCNCRTMWIPSIYLLNRHQRNSTSLSIQGIITSDAYFTSLQISSRLGYTYQYTLSTKQTKGSPNKPKSVYHSVSYSIFTQPTITLSNKKWLFESTSIFDKYKRNLAPNLAFNETISAIDQTRRLVYWS